MPMKKIGCASFIRFRRVCHGANGLPDFCIPFRGMLNSAQVMENAATGPSWRTNGIRPSPIPRPAHPW